MLDLPDFAWRTDRKGAATKINCVTIESNGPVAAPQEDSRTGLAGRCRPRPLCARTYPAVGGRRRQLAIRAHDVQPVPRGHGRAFSGGSGNWEGVRKRGD